MVNHIVVDSGCDIDSARFDDSNCVLTHVPLNLQIEDKLYLDDATFNQDEYMAAMEASSIAVKTSAPSPGLFLEQFKKGDNVFVVTLSSKLSATYQSAITARYMYADEYGKKFIHVFDSLAASVGESAIVLKLSELLGSGLPASEVVDQVNQFIKGMNTYFVLDKFDNLVKTGRISPYIAKVASLLNIKPVCGSENGEIKMVSKARGYSRALAKLVNIIKENTPDIESRVINITHVKAYEKAMELKAEFLKHLNSKGVEVHESKGVTTTYANRGGIVVAL